MVVSFYTRRVKSVERFIKRRNGLLCGEKQFPAKQGIKYLSLRAAVQFSERRYARHPEKFIAISILRAYRFHRLHFLASSYILRREQKRDKDKGGGKNFFLSIFFSLIDGWRRRKENFRRFSFNFSSKKKRSQ